MTKSAKFIRDKLERENILESIFSRYPEYHLMVVGHSLGAGTGAILAILMKKKYETVQCFAYSPPQSLKYAIINIMFILSFLVNEDGYVCCFSLKAAKYCEDFVTSVVVGNDVISR